MRNRFLAAVFSAVAFGACAPAAQQDQDGSEKPIEEFNTFQFPRVFTGAVEYRDRETPARVLESSSYLSSSPDSEMGCILLMGGRDMTLVFRNRGRDQLRLHIRNIQVRETRDEYWSLSDVRLDGFSPSKNFRFDSSKSGYQVEFCDARIQLASSSMGGSVSCKNVTYGLKQAHLDVKFTCVPVRR